MILIPTGSERSALCTYLRADRICVHHRFHAVREIFFTLRLVRFRNCFSEPEDMYSVMNMTCEHTGVQIRQHADVRTTARSGGRGGEGRRYCTEL